MKRHVKFTTLLLAMVFLLSMTAGCSKSQEMQERTIRISISTSYGTLTSNIMKEYQLLEKYLPDYTTVEWKTMTSASDMRDVLDELLDRLGLTRANVIYSGGRHLHLYLPNTTLVKASVSSFVTCS